MPYARSRGLSTQAIQEFVSGYDNAVTDTCNQLMTDYENAFETKLQLQAELQNQDRANYEKWFGLNKVTVPNGARVQLSVVQLEGKSLVIPPDQYIAEHPL